MNSSSLRSLGRPARALGLILLVALATRLAGLGAPAYDWDEGTYWQSLEALRRGHPLFAEVYSSQPPLFLHAVEPLYSWVGGGIGIARLEVVVLSMVAIPAVYYLARWVAGGWAGVVAAAVAVADPLFLRESLTLQADAISAALGAAAVAGGVWASGRRRAWPWLLTGALLAAGVGIKLLALASGPPLLVIAWRARERRTALLAMAAGFVAMAGFILLPDVGHLGSVYQQAIGLHVGTRTAEPQSLAEKLGVLVTYHPPWLALAAGLVGLVLVWVRERTSALLISVWLLAALIVDLGQAPLFFHHLAIATLPLAVLAGIAPVLLWRFSGSVASRGLALKAASVAVALGAVAPLWQPALPATDPRIEPVAAALRSLVPPGSTVVSDLGFATARAGMMSPPQLVDVSFARIRTGDLTAAAAERITSAAGANAVVFATGRLASLTGFRDWVRAHYRLASEPAADVQIWIAVGTP